MEYLNNKYVSTALGLVLVSNLYEFSPKMPLIIRRYRNNIIAQFIMVFLFCLLLIKDIQDALLISIVYMALFFIMDKIEGFDDETQIDDSEYLEHRYREEHYNNLENLENFANKKIKQEIKNNKSLKIKSALKKSSKSSLKNPNKNQKITFSPKNLALLKAKEEKKNVKHHKDHKEHFDNMENFGCGCSGNSSGLLNANYFDNFDGDGSMLQGVEAFDENVMNLNEF